VGSDQAAFQAIERVYRDRGAGFLRLALAQTGDLDSARDAVQEGFARAIRRRASFRSTGSIEAWLARCVINAAHDARRRSGHSTPAVQVPDVANAFDSGADSLVVREAVTQLPRQQRDALFLRYYLEFDYAAIAEVLGVAVGTVSATLHAARTSLRQALQEVQR
jgi:RNA polymerase sigma-70 factor (ECF subfamily)